MWRHTGVDAVRCILAAFLTLAAGMQNASSSLTERLNGIAQMALSSCQNWEVSHGTVSPRRTLRTDRNSTVGGEGPELNVHGVAEPIFAALKLKLLSGFNLD